MKAASIIRQETITLTLHSSGRRLCPLPSTSLPTEPADESTVKSISFPRESIHFLAPPSFPLRSGNVQDGGRERGMGLGMSAFPHKKTIRTFPAAVTEGSQERSIVENNTKHARARK